MHTLATALKIDCKGVSLETVETLGENREISVSALKSKEVEEAVIVKVYKDGRSEPLCKYLSEGKCTADSLNPENQGYCPYDKGL